MFPRIGNVGGPGGKLDGRRLTIRRRANNTVTPKMGNQIASENIVSSNWEYMKLANVGKTASRVEVPRLWVYATCFSAATVTRIPIGPKHCSSKLPCRAGDCPRHCMQLDSCSASTHRARLTPPLLGCRESILIRRFVVRRISASRVVQLNPTRLNMRSQTRVQGSSNSSFMAMAGDGRQRWRSTQNVAVVRQCPC